MKNNHQKKDLEGMSKAISKDFENAVFSCVDATNGTAFRDKRLKLNTRYNEQESVDPVTFKIIMCCYAGFTVLALIGLALVLHFKSMIGGSIVGLFGGFTIGSCIAYLVISACRLLAFKNTYKKMKRLYAEVKALAEDQLSLPLTLVESDFTADGFCFGFAETSDAKEVLSNYY